MCDASEDGIFLAYLQGAIELVCPCLIGANNFRFASIALSTQFTCTQMPDTAHFLKRVFTPKYKRASVLVANFNNMNAHPNFFVDVAV